MNDKFYYDGPDDDVIDEDRVGRVPNDTAILSLVFGIVSLLLVLFFRSGVLAIIFGALAWVNGQNALKVDRQSKSAQAGKILGMIGVILGTLFFVTCISCVSCLGCNRYRPLGETYRQFRGSWRF